MKPNFLCPKCKAEMTLPACSACGYQLPMKGAIYQFCDDAAIKLDGDDQYIGYDRIGEDFEPAIACSGENSVTHYGVYDECAKLVAETFGTDITVLDLGAGLGTASVPLARNGICTIAADISNVMLSTAVKRAGGRLETLHIVRMNAYELFLPDNSVDIVVENAMLHLVDNPEKVLREIVRVLKPHGKLVRFSSPAKSLSEEEKIHRDHCNRIIERISSQYYDYLSQNGYKEICFDPESQNVGRLLRYFERPYNVISMDFTEEFKDKMRFRMHRLKTGAHSDLQSIPREVLDAAWKHADAYAKDRFGEHYAELRGFSRYGAGLDVYTLREDTKKPS